jgi:hypothetical protein
VFGVAGGVRGRNLMWQVEWKAISARIAALVEAGTYLATALGERGHDGFGAAVRLLQNAIDTRALITRFQDNYGAQFPEIAKDCLTRFLDGQFPEVVRGMDGTRAALTMLASFRAEFTYLLNDTEAVGRSLVVRAFTHLKRSIVADPDVRSRWAKAFHDGEPACEKMGACHLLLHGIWAFKAHAAGGRTDLVLGKNLSDNLDLRSAAEALVLTEWKLVRDPVETERMANVAYKQAKRYPSELLAGFELSSRKYLVLVSSEDLFPMPGPRTDAGVTYEYINVPVSPNVPSELSRRAASKSGGLGPAQ